MKNLPALALFFLVLFSIPVTGTAEYVFKKDGSILKGTIVKDDPSYIMVRSDSGKSDRVNRNDLLRILYTELYMGKVYIRLTSGEVVDGYQVDEDRDNYTFRRDISKPEEFVLSRKKVMFIARTNPTDLTSSSSIERILLKWSPPFKPAKMYKVYVRENKKGTDFAVAGETDDFTYTLKNLNKSASYEVYVTAISDTGEESFPSEKIITNTIPLPPEDLVMTEKYSADGKSVTLTMTWKKVTDEGSRVKSYNIYNIDEKDKKKLGTVTENEFVIKDFPAEGRHWFAVVSVNDLAVESEKVKAVYDAGYKFYTMVSGVYIFPAGKLGVIADCGYGGILDISIAEKEYSAGFETGFISFKGADDDIEKMQIIPLLATIDYCWPFLGFFALRPSVKAGAGYIMTEYAKHNPADPAVTTGREKNKFNPMASAGLYLEFTFMESFNLFAGGEYTAIFEKSGTMRYSGCTFGASVLF